MINNPSPFFTILMPVLNRVESIKEAIQSVQTQTSKDFELIIVDNGSTDGTLEYCRNLKMDNLILLECTTKGLAFARNTGIKKANGEWVLLLDSDNQLKETDTLKSLTKTIQEKESNTLFMTRCIDKKNSFISRAKNFDREINLSFYVNNMHGEFAPIVKAKWFKQNLYPEISECRTEFPDVVWYKCLTQKKCYISSLVTQIYGTEDQNRICSPEVNKSRARELSIYYGMLLTEYKEELLRTCGYLKVYTLIIKLLMYNKISDYYSEEELKDLAPSYFIALQHLLPPQLIRFIIETKKSYTQ